MAVTMFVFTSLHSASDAYWMLPMMGFAQLAVFAGYSIYFPELFPTRLRGNGRGLLLQHRALSRCAGADSLRISGDGDVVPHRGSAHVEVYLVGTVALIWAPETKGKPLPED